MKDHRGSAEALVLLRPRYYRGPLLASSCWLLAQQIYWHLQQGCLFLALQYPLFVSMLLVQHLAVSAPTAHSSHLPMTRPLRCDECPETGFRASGIVGRYSFSAC